MCCSHAGGVHRDIELSKETEVKLFSNDVSKSSEEVCQQCYDSECTAAEVSHYAAVTNCLGVKATSAFLMHLFSKLVVPDRLCI